MPIENHKKKIIKRTSRWLPFILYFLKPFKSKAECRDEEKN